MDIVYSPEFYQILNISDMYTDIIYVTKLYCVGVEFDHQQIPNQQNS